MVIVALLLLIAILAPVFCVILTEWVDHFYGEGPALVALVLSFSVFFGVAYYLGGLQ